MSQNGEKQQIQMFKMWVFFVFFSNSLDLYYPKCIRSYNHYAKDGYKSYGWICCINYILLSTSYVLNSYFDPSYYDFCFTDGVLIVWTPQWCQWGGHWCGWVLLSGIQARGCVVSFILQVLQSSFSGLFQFWCWKLLGLPEGWIGIHFLPEGQKPEIRGGRFFEFVH